jgi:hypothetical protein
VEAQDISAPGVCKQESVVITDPDNTWMVLETVCISVTETFYSWKFQGGLIVLFHTMSQVDVSTS